MYDYGLPHFFTAKGTVRIPMGSDREYNAEVCLSNKLSCNKLYIKGPMTNEEWVLGFRSYDGNGIVYRDRYGDYRFFRVYKFSMGTKTYRNRKNFDLRKFCIMMAVEQERKITKELKELFSDDDRFGFTRLLYSGVGSKGTDIIMHSSDRHFDVSDTSSSNLYVHSSLVAIEVLGTNYSDGSPKFIYGKGKDFLHWFHDCWDYGVAPVICWQDLDKNTYFVFLWESDILEKIFWTRWGFKRYGYRQRTTLSPISLTKPYRLDAQGFKRKILDMYRDDL